MPPRSPKRVRSRDSDSTRRRERLERTPSLGASAADRARSQVAEARAALAEARALQAAALAKVEAARADADQAVSTALLLGCAAPASLRPPTCFRCGCYYYNQ